MSANELHSELYPVAALRELQCPARLYDRATPAAIGAVASASQGDLGKARHVRSSVADQTHSQGPSRAPAARGPLGGRRKERPLKGPTRRSCATVAETATVGQEQVEHFVVYLKEREAEADAEPSEAGEPLSCACEKATPSARTTRPSFSTPEPPCMVCVLPPPAWPCAKVLKSFVPLRKRHMSGSTRPSTSACVDRWPNAASNSFLLPAGSSLCRLSRRSTNSAWSSRASHTCPGYYTGGRPRGAARARSSGRCP